MEKNVRLVILEHLGHQLYIHILYVDFLQSVSHLQQAERELNRFSYLKALV